MIKLNVNFSQLWGSVMEMGAQTESFKVGRIEMPVGLNSSSGAEVDISEVSTLEPNGPPVLIYQGQQIMLFIPDHSFGFYKAIEDPRGKNARRFHIANCETVKKLREDKRFERFKITNSQDGFFEITGKSKSEKGSVQLAVCQNCLKELNYNNFNSFNGKQKTKVVLGFNIPNFFETYKSFFINKPRNPYAGKVGYPDNWNSISREYRKKIDYICESCGVDLKTYPHLLHVHHRNGVKHDTKDSNLKALCEICHSEEPAHGHMNVSSKSRSIILKLRR